MKRIFLLLLITLSFIFGVDNVNAQKIIDKISIEVMLNKDGSAHIIEKWDVRLDNGTEIFKPITNLGESEISNFKVIDENNQVFVNVDWNPLASFEEKKYKSGINYIDDGVELCFGISNYGEHTYTLEYDVSNIIFNVEDAQVLYWNFINKNMNPTPNKFDMKISGYYTFPDNLEVWGYGYKGLAYVWAGDIYFSNDKYNFNDDYYGVALVKFPKDTFSNKTKNSKFDTFKSVYKTAEKGAKKPFYLERYDIGKIIEISFYSLLIIGTIIFSLWAKQKVDNKEYRKLKKVEYFRDIPCGGDIYKSLFLIDLYNIKNKWYQPKILAITILKFLKQNKVSLIKLKNDTNFSIQLNSCDKFDNNIEKGLYEFLERASVRGIVTKRNFIITCANNYKYYFELLRKFREYGENEFINGKEIEKIRPFSNKFKVSENVYNEAKKLAGLKKFLDDFTLIDARQLESVYLLEDYILYATLFGNAKRVCSQLKELYATIRIDNEIIEALEEFERDSSRECNKVWNKKEKISNTSKARRYKSGGGGFSSTGGGSSSFGGGSSGGVR